MGKNFKFIYDVFLSYSWADKSAVLKIHAALKSRKLKVWFDEIDMRDNLSAAMAEGIESSAVFVCCLSKSYEKSNNAMSEFRYAFHVKKKFIAIRFEDGKRLSEIEFVVGPMLWFLYENGDEKQLSQAAYYIEKEVLVLNPQVTSGRLRMIKLVDINYCATSKCIGSGGFGSIYKIKLDETEEVVFKKMHDSNPSMKAKREFINEAEIMAQLSHPRLVRFYGIVDDLATKTMGIVMEFVSRGSLYDLIDSLPSPLSISKRMLILLDVSTGIKVLHDQKILHKDIKSQNILVDEQWRAKICDFGLAKIKREVTTQNAGNTQTLAGTATYMAPELLNLKPASEATDVFAFAVVVSEVVTWSGPYGLDLDEIDQRALYQRVVNADIPSVDLPEDIPSGFAEFLSECMNFHPKERPSFMTICEKLRGFLKLVSNAAETQDTIEEDLSSKFNSILNSEIRPYELDVSQLNESNESSESVTHDMTGASQDHESHDETMESTELGQSHESVSHETKEPTELPDSHISNSYQTPESPDILELKSPEAVSHDSAEPMKFPESSKTLALHESATLKLETKLTGGNSVSNINSIDTLVVTDSNLYIESAFERKKRKAEEGDAAAQNQLGDRYYFGNGVTKDYNEAVKWFTKSAEQGNSSGQYSLGYCYRNGYGVAKDYNKAVKWYTKAAEQGNSSGQYNLADCYEKGIGVTKDETEALRWYKMSAEQGDKDAARKVKELYSSASADAAQVTSTKKSWFKKLIS